MRRFSKIGFSSKSSCCQMNCSFHKPDKTFHLKSQVHSLNPKTIQQQFSSTTISDCSSGYVDCNFDKGAQNWCPNVRERFSIMFFQIIFFSENYGQLKGSLDKPARKFLPKNTCFSCSTSGNN